MALWGGFWTSLCSFSKVLTKSTGLTGICLSKKNGKSAAGSLVRQRGFIIFLSTVVIVTLMETRSQNLRIDATIEPGSAPLYANESHFDGEREGLSDALSQTKAFTGNPGANRLNSVCVVTRSRDDFKVLDNFIQHYFEEGIEEIWVIEDSNAMYKINGVWPNVHLKRMDLSLLTVQRQMDPVGDLIRSGEMDGCEWIVSVDVDEFLTTRRNPCKTVVEEIRDSFGTGDSISVPWVFYSSTHDNVDDVRTDVLMRWNHSEHHGHNSTMHKYRDRYRQIETKPIFRRSKFIRFSSPHGAVLRNGSTYVDGASGKTITYRSTHFKNKYHEDEIKKLFALVESL